MPPRKTSKPNGESKRLVTVRDIAAELGIHFTTVAEALRDSPRVKDTTKKRVKDAAERMGYKAEPMLSALSTYRARKQNPVIQGILVWINGFDSKDFFSTGSGFYPECYLGAQKRCSELGYKLEPFWMSEPGMTPARASKILQDRKASGVIVGPMPLGFEELELDWDSLCSVRIGYSLKKYDLTTIIADQFGNARLLHEKLLNFGFQRIGFSCPRILDHRTNNHWLGGYLAAQESLPSDQRLAPFVEQDLNHDPSKFLSWVKSQRPDVIMIGGGLRYYQLLLENGYSVPGEICVVSLHADSHGESLAGISQNGKNVGIVAVDHLVGIIHGFKVGLETRPKTVTILGEWKDCSSFVPPSAKD